MIRVIVQRDPADNQGPTITDSLITSEPVAIERGRNEIDQNCSSRQQVNIAVSPAAVTGSLRVNRLVEVQAVDAAPWVGLLKSVSYSQSFEAETLTLTIEREIV